LACCLSRSASSSSPCSASQATRRCSLWLTHGFESLLAKQWSGHSKASMLTDVYGYVLIDPNGDEWRDFRLEAYDAQRRPKAVERRPGVAPVRPGGGD
jgi:hypothetical protein